MVRLFSHKPHPDASPSVEPAVLDRGRRLLDAAARHRRSILHGSWWSDRLMNLVMRDDAAKVALFRFVDVYPMLQHDADRVRDHLRQYLPHEAGPLQWAGALTKLPGIDIARQIERMAQRFILAESPEAALPELQKLHARGMTWSIDLLGEACLSHAETAAYQQRYLDLIDALTRPKGFNPPAPDINISLKISALAVPIDPIDFTGSLGRLFTAIEPILRHATEKNVTVNFDMEQHALKELTIALFEQCCERIDFPAALAMQAYLRSGDDDAARLIDWAKTTGRSVTVRLVKGAYWDYELAVAEQNHWPVPVYQNKADTDANFERMAERFIDAHEHIRLAVGSHNVRSIAAVLAMCDQRRLPPDTVEFQMLHGMADDLADAMIDEHLRLCLYCPVGELIPGMAYLVRRLLENTSNQSWLRAAHTDHVPVEQLLRKPERDEAGTDSASFTSSLRPSVPPSLPPFTNEPPRDFADAAQREAFAQAVNHATVPHIANDATLDDVREAASRAERAFTSWRDTPITERCDMLGRAAELMRQRRDALAALVVAEAGKPWRQADGDVCEAVDFLEFYRRSATSLFAEHPLPGKFGEANQRVYEPRGVAAIISPWNFPAAICCGMTAAALATGNTAIVKPAEQTPAVARAVCECLWQAGVPEDVLQLLPGVGETVGAALVRDPRVALIAFTGSREVGFDILSAATQTSIDQPQIKKVVCEMGGKNAIIVDDSADLDEAVKAVRDSAFGYSGQKCSACSRAIILPGVYDSFVRRLIEATRSLIVGDPRNPATQIGPLIDDAAMEKVRGYLKIAAAEGKLELPPEIAGRYVGPCIVTGIRPEHRIAQEEIFGPLLAVMAAANFDEAVQWANASCYRLTGGLFSRTPNHITRAKREFRVGNLYINRAITGALVGRQPFGGFGHSGTGTQAGGEDYLLHFVLPRTITENTMRHGFAPTTE